MVEGRSYLQVWGLTHQLRSVQDATPAQIVRRRKSVKPYGQAEQAKNQGIAEDVGYAPPVIDSDGGMYPRISAPYRPVHDPHPAAFIFLTIEIFLRDREVYRALAQRVYIHAKDVGHFRYRQVLRDELIGETGIWLVASQRSAEREHAKLRKAIAELFEESYEPSIAQKAAKELLGELSEAEKIKRRYERRKAKRERIQKRHENVEPIIDDSRLLYMGVRVNEISPERPRSGSKLEAQTTENTLETTISVKIPFSTANNFQEFSPQTSPIGAGDIPPVQPSQAPAPPFPKEK